MGLSTREPTGMSALLVEFQPEGSAIRTPKSPPCNSFFRSDIRSKSYHDSYDIRYVHYSPEISKSFLPTAMTLATPVLPFNAATLADSDPTTSQGEVDKEQSQSNNADFEILLPKDFGFIPVPRRLRYDPTKPFYFGLMLNIAFGLASTFSQCFNSPSPPPLLLGILID